VTAFKVRRSARKNFFEAALLPFFLTRPFRCESCGNRFCGLAFRRRLPPSDYATPMADIPQAYRFWSTDAGKDEEPFREETNLHLLSLRGGLITLGTSVQPGQQLILMNVATEEDQRSA